jgi:hypothetical protein
MLLQQMGLSYESFLRWKRRMNAGEEPVFRPGPKKLERIDLAGLNQSLAGLHHARKRTHGTKELLRQYSLQVSRRQLNAMVVEARKEHTHREAAALQRIHWHYPDLAWAVDGSEFAAEPVGDKLILCAVQDSRPFCQTLY